MMRKSWFWVVVPLILSGCLRPPSMTAEIDRVKGQKLDNVLVMWGYPTSEKTVAGRKLLYWENYYGARSNKAGTDLTSNHCIRILEVDASQAITGGSWEGAGCSRLAYLLQTNRP